MRLLICAGGTGGGVYPALSVLQAVGDRANATLWVGGKGGMEADLVARHNIPYDEIPAAGVHGVNLTALPGNLVKLARGVIQSRRILKEFEPDVLFFTGGFVAIPMAFAGRRLKSLLFVPDIEPGLAIKTIARSADVIALTADKSRQYFNSSQRLVVTGYPTRRELKAMAKSEARTFFNLSEDLPVMLIVGGSKGARSINQAVVGCLKDLLELAQVVHISGQLDWESLKDAASGLPESLASRYHIYSFLHEEIGAAFASADLVVSRAGASTLGELPLFGLPAILVPYPYAWRYQKVNADHLISHGAAVLVENSLLPDQLLPVVKALFSDRSRLDEMSRNMRLLSTPHAAEGIADLLVELGKTRAKGEGK